MNTPLSGYEIEQNGTRYQHHLEEKTWLEASETCEAGGGRLAVINSEAIQKFVIRLFGNKGEFWFGLTDEKKEGDWVWVNGEKLGTAYWASNQPSGGNQNCAVFNYGEIGKWDDQGCNTFHHGFLCQKTPGKFLTQTMQL
jgi:hypothetical protein